MRSSRVCRQGFDLNSLKSFVSKVTQQGAAGSSAGSSMTVSGGSGGALATGSGPLGAAGFMSSIMAEAQKMASVLMEEKEWQCPCGHKFRASGEWIATVPTLCEVPSCPNPKYYVSGEGRALLEANPGGVRLEQVDPSKAIPASTSGGASNGNGCGGGGCGGSMGGRFGPRK